MAPKAAASELDPAALSIIEEIRAEPSLAARWRTLQALRALIPQAELDVINEAVLTAGGDGKYGAVPEAARELGTTEQIVKNRRRGMVNSSD